tara:strand:+ start:123 stop:1127 length:1005 start_codon:yes stop_codon:yes gene_type:complete
VIKPTRSTESKDHGRNLTDPRDSTERDRLGSIEAQEFISKNPASGVISPKESSIEQFRGDSSAFFIPRAKRALSLYNVSVDQTIISGVRCLELIPKTNTVHGTVLHCFGGGFVCGSPYETLVLAAPISEYSDSRIVIPEYRLSPENLWPDAIEDCFTVYKKLQDISSEAPLAISGDSAGGNLALAIALRAHRENIGVARAIALLSPWCDLTNRGESLSNNDGRDPTLTRAWVLAATELYAPGENLSNPALSPIFDSYPAGFPPVMITTGTRDLLMSQSVELAKRLGTAEVECKIKIWNNLWHVFEYYDEIPESKISLQEIARFLSSKLKPEHQE